VGVDVIRTIIAPCALRYQDKLSEQSGKWQKLSGDGKLETAVPIKLILLCEFN